MGKTPDKIDYVVHEATIARMQDEIERMERRNTKDHETNEKRFNRLYIALILAIALICISNIGWLVYESMFETITYEQDGQGINNFNNGKQGDISNEGQSKDNNKEKEAR